MSDPLKQFWAWVGAGTVMFFGLATGALILKDQQGAVNVLNASGGFVTAVSGAVGKLGT